MGAFVGGLFAQGADADEIAARCWLEFVRGNPMGDYRIPRVSLTHGGRARAMVERNFLGLIEDLPRSFYSVATDLLASELVVFRRGRLDVAVGTSMLIPGVFPPFAHEDRLLVDGGVLDNLPTGPMAEDAEGMVIAVDVTSPPRETDRTGELTLPDTLMRLMLLSRPEEEQSRARADLVIAPEDDGIGQLEFYMLDRMREAGRRAALDALERAPAEAFW